MEHKGQELPVGHGRKGVIAPSAADGCAHIALHVFRRSAKRLRDLRVEIAAQVAKQAVVLEKQVERF